MNNIDYKLIIKKLISEQIANNNYASGAGSSVKEVIRLLNKNSKNKKITTRNSVLVKYMEKIKLIKHIKSSGRSVYEINGGEWVLKIDNGTTQNYAESHMENIINWGKFAPKVIAKDEYATWIISEKVIPINTDKKSLGHWVDLVGLSYLCYNNDSISNIFPYNFKVLIYALVNPIIFDVYSGTIKADLYDPEIKVDLNILNTPQLFGVPEESEFKTRVVFYTILKHYFIKNNINNINSIDQFILNFSNNDFVKTAIRVCNYIDLNELFNGNLGITTDGFPVVLDTGK